VLEARPTFALAARHDVLTDLANSTHLFRLMDEVRRRERWFPLALSLKTESKIQ
jgi:hypothetical protein